MKRRRGSPESHFPYLAVWLGPLYISHLCIALHSHCSSTGYKCARYSERFPRPSLGPDVALMPLKCTLQAMKGAQSGAKSGISDFQSIGER